MINNDSGFISEQATIHFSDVAATTSHVYLLYFGFSFAEKNDPNFEKVSTVLKLDWEGQLVSSYGVPGVVGVIDVVEGTDYDVMYYTQIEDESGMSSVKSIKFDK